MNQPQQSSARLLVVVDDGWRYERRELLAAMRARMDFDIATHDEATHAYLQNDYRVFLLARRPLKGRLGYTLTMFFAREHDTNIVRTMNEIRYRTSRPFRRFLMTLRRWAGWLGLRRYTYHQALSLLYRRSREHQKLLQNYDAVMFTPVNVLDKRIIHEARNAGLMIICSVYSWDNPMKDNEFPPDADHYLVWNDPCRQQIVTVYGVPEAQIHLVGPTQFEFILQRRPGPASGDRHRRYVLFACSVGVYDFLIDQEIRLIRLVRRILDGIDPMTALVVRPYPFAGVKDPYAALRGAAGIEVADFGAFNEWRLEIGAKDLEEKMRQIEGAECLINVGSTIALEASYTRTPIVQILFNPANDYASWQDLGEILKNDHLRFIIHPECPNIVTSEEQLDRVLSDILAGRTQACRRYSEILQEFARPMDVPSYHALFIQTLEKCLALDKTG